MLRFDSEKPDVLDRTTPSQEASNMSDRPPSTRKASNVSDKPPSTHEASNVSDRPPSTHKTSNVSDRPPSTHKASNVSDRPPSAHKASNVSDRPPSTRKASNVSDRPQSTHKASNVSDRPPSAHKASNVSDRPASTHKASNVSDRPPSAHMASNAPHRRDRHLPTIPEKNGSHSPQENISVTSKDSRLHSSLRERPKSRRVPTVEKITEEFGERRSQWELLMRKFSEDCKVHKKCRLSPLDYACRSRDTQHFITGSSYTGTWNILGMNGYGTFKFPNGVEYEGEFYDSLFHGEGVLKYPNGVRLVGRWEQGVLKAKTLTFADGVEYDEEGWRYCHMPDRRFLIERETELKPGTESIMTADQPTRPVPPGLYDAGDGFFDPEAKAVFKYDNPTSPVRFVGPKEQKWVEENCRTSIDASVGPKESLYEKWADPTKPDDVTDATGAPSARESLCEEFASAWGRQSLVSGFGRRAFIKFDPQADAEQEEHENDSTF